MGIVTSKDVDFVEAHIRRTKEDKMVFNFWGAGVRCPCVTFVRELMLEGITTRETVISISAAITEMYLLVGLSIDICNPEVDTTDSSIASAVAIHPSLKRVGYYSDSCRGIIDMLKNKRITSFELRVSTPFVMLGPALLCTDHIESLVIVGICPLVGNDVVNFVRQNKKLRYLGLENMFMESVIDVLDMDINMELISFMNTFFMKFDRDKWETIVEEKLARLARSDCIGSACVGGKDLFCGINCPRRLTATWLTYTSRLADVLVVAVQQ